jgi:hypothetical protein
MRKNCKARRCKECVETQLDYNRLAAIEQWGNRKSVLAKVGQNGNTLQHASAELWGDREVVLVAVGQNGNARANHASAALGGFGNFQGCTAQGQMMARQPPMAGPGDGRRGAAPPAGRGREMTLPTWMTAKKDADFQDWPAQGHKAIP